MNSTKEITVFTVGDSRQPGTWSNVPYFFTKNLENKGIKVNRVNLEENKTLHLLYKFSFFALLKLLYSNSDHSYFRSGLNYFLSRLKIKKAIADYPNCELLAFLSFSFSASGISNTPVLLFGDWTYEYSIRNFKNREALWFEKAALRREKANIESAKLVLGLFPLSVVFIKQNYRVKNCHYLGNVINSEETPVEEKLLQKKLGSRKVLFIGNRKYISGAMELISSFKKVRSAITDTELHFIGLTEKETNITSAGIFYHGYLDKGIEKQKTLYYKLIFDARVIVNTNAGWGAFSAITEAMYFYTPVITSRYNEFTETYGKEIKFGLYTDEKPGNELANLLERILSAPDNELTRMMVEANKVVKDFTWRNYSTRMLELLNQENGLKA